MSPSRLVKLILSLASSLCLVAPPPASAVTCSDGSSLATRIGLASMQSEAGADKTLARYLARTGEQLGRAEAFVATDRLKPAKRNLGAAIRSISRVRSRVESVKHRPRGIDGATADLLATQATGALEVLRDERANVGNPPPPCPTTSTTRAVIVPTTTTTLPAVTPTSTPTSTSTTTTASHATTTTVTTTSTTQTSTSGSVTTTTRTHLTFTIRTFPSITFQTSTTMPKLDYTAISVYGEANLSNGFSPDPYSVGMTTGGPVDVSYLGASCSGFATVAPSLRVNFGGGGASLLRIYFVGSNGDPSIVVNDPFGNFYCVDDSFGTVNPTIDFNNPAGGTYDVWIGSFASGTTISGTLYVTESSGNHP